MQGFTNFNNINANTVDFLHASSTYENNKLLALDANSGFNPKNYLQQGEPILSNLNEGRLTLTTGVPVTTSDVTAATTLYFTPYNGNKISIYESSQTIWRVYDFEEISLDISSLTADTNYDIFIYDNAGTLILESVGWTDGTTRATDIVLQNGVYVKDGATDKKCLGSIRITGTTGQCEDSISNRFVNNLYNRTLKEIKAIETTNDWNYTTTTWRPFNNNSSCVASYVESIIRDRIQITVKGTAVNASGATIATGVGLNSTNTNSAQILGGVASTSTTVTTGYYFGPSVTVGLNSVYPLETSQANGTTNWHGDRGLSYYQNGLIGLINC